jgi:hypothetical protein
VATHDRDRAVALSRQLAQAHQELRSQLADIRLNLGERHPRSGKLTTHCLAFCTALTAHHQGEDAGMFTDLLRHRPDLADTVKNLVQDHEMIASILLRVAQLARPAADHGPEGEPADRHSIALELDGLAAIMESHFRYEERAISDALDRGTADTGWSDQVFRFRSRG